MWLRVWLLRAGCPIVANIGGKGTDREGGRTNDGRGVVTPPWRARERECVCVSACVCVRACVLVRVCGHVPAAGRSGHCELK